MAEFVQYSSKELSAAGMLDFEVPNPLYTHGVCRLPGPLKAFTCCKKRLREVENDLIEHSR